MRKQLWFLGALLFVAAVSFAQQPPPTLSAAAEVTQSGPTEDIRLLPETESSGDLVKQSQALIDRMTKAVAEIDKKRENSQNQKDLIKLNCLSSKANQAKEQLDEAKAAMKTLLEAQRQGDNAGRTFAANRIRIFFQKVQVLNADADNCAGEDASYVGPNKTEVEVDPTVPKGDPTDPGLPTPTATLAPVGVEEAARDSPSSKDTRGTADVISVSP